MWLNPEAIISGSHLQTMYPIIHDFNSWYPYLHIRLMDHALQTGFPCPHVSRLDSCGRPPVKPFKTKFSYNLNITICVYKRSINKHHIQLSNWEKYYFSSKIFNNNAGWFIKYRTVFAKSKTLNIIMKHHYETALWNNTQKMLNIDIKV
jgi:hypothetical protein